MHDIRAIRENPAQFDADLGRRGMPPMSSRILAIDEARRAKILAAETAQAAQNAASKQVGAAKASGDEAEFERLRALVAEKKSEIARLQEEAAAEDAKLRDLLMGLPNPPLAEVPDGADEAGNVELRRWGSPRDFGFSPKEHFEIAGVKPGMDFATAAKLSGSRFVVLRGAVIRVHRALAQFMLDTHVNQHGLTETWTPVLVKEEAMIGTGQLPKFAEDSYQTTNGWWLVPTSEVTLTNTVAGDILEAGALPIRLTAHSQCFRSEAGSAGKDTSGMLRQHQFEKVEMVSITHPDESLAEHERMTGCAEAILQKLGLPYRVMVLCTGDMGFGARKTHDLEVWLPGQNTYREISSVSVCGDFQARRMNARFRPEGGGKPEFVHTLNGSGLAVGRALIAVLENGQQEDGSVTLPEALHPYLGGKTRISAEGALT
ncbi:seryl-tRNA synthetase [Defluviimonas sp. 20V17]|uniref:Serine--tRNA ligase n=1 Tax=Allgaiera indica TaxID=765699 RepID=A0AAN4URW5_9RHOB|nr:serine--tRNA ligase [Allgaiera indica]KDB02226.1 seryl-tRNA synthetase [Defluviimonas sp. 20V17]GHE02699.1 serine--tRNA ligase [Allgaiera indica]SDX19031.1 seryl-tRNA synthetase [Allgaiera indica]